MMMKLFKNQNNILAVEIIRRKLNCFIDFNSQQIQPSLAFNMNH